jgi:hypothetical protein
VTWNDEGFVISNVYVWWEASQGYWARHKEVQTVQEMDLDKYKMD